MIPLPYATKENYKIMLYRLADTDPDKVCTTVDMISAKLRRKKCYLFI